MRTSCCSSLLVVVGLGPLLWLAKSAVTPTQDTLRQPLALWPNGIDWANLAHGVERRRRSASYFLNTVVIARRLVARASCSSRRPAATCWRCCGRGTRRVLNGAVLATLFVPPVVLLVPLYLTVARPAARRHVAAQHLLGGLAAGRRERVQRRCS